jgi:hypothetical protein
MPTHRALAVLLGPLFRLLETERLIPAPVGADESTFLVEPRPHAPLTEQMTFE